jgi:copper chaperone CopZ
MAVKEIKIQGMACNHCIISVRKELEKIPHLQVKDVKIGAATVVYDDAHVSHAQIAAAIEEAGYIVDV